MKILFWFLLVFFFCEVVYAGYTRQDGAGNWITTNDNGSTTYYTQGADLTSWYSNTVPSTYYRPATSYTPINYFSNSTNSFNPTAFFQMGRQIGAANTPTFNSRGLWVLAGMQALQNLSQMAESKQFQQVPQISRTYFDDGKIASEATLLNGKLEGPWRTYFQSGEIQVEGTAKNNIVQGSVKGYFENGRLQFDGNFENNELNGPYIEYWGDGRIKEKGEAVNGQPTNQTFYS